MKESKLKGASMPIDPKALKSCIERVGTVEEVAGQMGYKSATLYGAFSRKYISKPMSIMLDSLYGIKYEFYKPEEKPKATYKQEIEDPKERYLFMILQELKYINEYICRPARRDK